jgi:hypothetical protein
MPKMDFPPFDGVDAHIWIDKCNAYFSLYQIFATFCVSATSLHMSGPTAHWYQNYMHFENFQSWEVFTKAVVSEFEANTHRTKVMELLHLKQTGSVEEYRKKFEQLVYNIRLYDSSLSEMMVISQFLIGLKDEIRHNVELMLPESVAKAAILASLQEHLLSSIKRSVKYHNAKAAAMPPKSDFNATSATTEVWQARQLKEYRRVNGMWYMCGEKYTPGHKCSTTSGVQNAQLSAITTESSDGGGLVVG